MKISCFLCIVVFSGSSQHDCLTVKSLPPHEASKGSNNSEQSKNTNPEASKSDSEGDFNMLNIPRKLHSKAYLCLNPSM